MQIDGIDVENFIDDAGWGEHTKSEVIEMLELVQDVYDAINAQIIDEEEYLKLLGVRDDVINGDIEKLIMAPEVQGIPTEQIKQLDESRETRERLRRYLEQLQTIRDSYKNFNKSACFANIRALLKTSDVKIGQIEREAGVRLGYMSRLEKPENTAEPSMEFILSAAKCLGVSIDFLIRAQLDEVTPTETYVLNFIKNIFDDTKADRMYWNREAAKKLNALHNDFEQQGQPHCLFTYAGSERTLDGHQYIASYQSRFFPESGVDITANAYNADLPRTSSKIYIVPCAIYKDDDRTESDSCFEVYVVDKHEVTPICNTLFTCNAVAEALNDLYKQIQIASSHIQINDKAKRIIDAYMKKNESESANSWMEIPDGIDELPFT